MLTKPSFKRELIMKMEFVERNLWTPSLPESLELFIPIHLDNGRLELVTFFNKNENGKKLILISSMERSSEHVSFCQVSAT